MTPLHKMTSEQRAHRAAYYKEYRKSPVGIAIEKRAIAKRKAKGSTFKRWGYVRTQYGISQEDFSQMLGEQVGCCKGCGKSFDMSSKRGADCCCVDHDHATGKVRGLLCRMCNITLGTMKDSAANLRRLAGYLDDSVQDVTTANYLPMKGALN